MDLCESDRLSVIFGRVVVVKIVVSYVVLELLKFN